MSISKYSSLLNIWKDSVETVPRGFCELPAEWSPSHPDQELAPQHTLVLAFLPSVSCFPIFSLQFPEITSYVNYLNSSPCLGSILGRIPTKTGVLQSSSWSEQAVPPLGNCASTSSI